MPVSLWVPAYVAVGSNLDDPESQVDTALTRLARIRETRLVSVSKHYKSAPMGPSDQPDYVNAVAALLTRLEPREFLAELLRIEDRMGRQRDVVKWGPRRIDLDLVVHGDNVSQEEELTLPHPGLAERVFVLQPLAEVGPGLQLPDGRRVCELLRKSDFAMLEPIIRQGEL